MTEIEALEIIRVRQKEVAETELTPEKLEAAILEGRRKEHARIKFQEYWNQQESKQKTK